MIKKFFRDNPIHEKVACKLKIMFICPLHHLFVIWGLVVLGIATSYHYLIGFPTNPIHLDFDDIILFLSSSVIYFSIILKPFSKYSSDSLNLLLFSNVKSISNNSVYSISLLQGLCILMSNSISFFISIVYLFLIVFHYYTFYRKDDIKNWSLKSFLAYSIILSISFYSVGWFFVMSKLDFEILLSLTLLLKSILPYIGAFFAISLVVYKSELDFNSSYNIKSISSVSAIVMFFVIVISWYINNPLLTISSIVSFPFYVYGILRSGEKDLLRMLRYSIFIFSFFPLTFYPLLSIGFIFIFYFCKYFFWHNYKIHFPAFAVD